MKSYNDLFDKIIDEENLKKAFLNASKGKRKRNDVKKVLKSLDRHVKILRDILINEQYSPRKHKKSIINENNGRKSRVIEKPDYMYEQVVHHALIQILQPIFRKGMYEYVCGSVPNRGSHYGKRYIKKWLRDDRKNTKYVLKMDIEKFYPSIKHEVIKNALAKKIRDKKALNLMFTIIDNCENGLPLGNYTSQWFANFLLQELDHLIKEKFKAKYYVRYMDDMVIFGCNKKELHKTRKAIEDYLNNVLQLNMKGNWQVFRFEYRDSKTGKLRGRPLDFMGFVFHREKITMRKSIMLRMTRKAKRIYKKDRPTIYDAKCMISYVGWLDHTDCYNVYLKYIKPCVNIQYLKRKISRYDRRVNRERLERSVRDRGISTA